MQSVLLHEDNLLVVVVDNLDVVGVPISPCKADTPAVIDSNAILSCSIPCQLFQTIGRRKLQIIEDIGIVEHAKFP